jgi:uncharacterized protein
MVDIQKLANFVKPFYANNDVMHDLSHAVRILKAARMLAEDFKDDVDLDLVVFGSYFHGMILEHGAAIEEFLKSLSMPEKKIHLVTEVARESLKEEVPKTLEGKILHDAHLIEGGKTFMVVKSLVTGSMRGQSLDETIEYVENNVIGKFSCHLPRSQKIYYEKEQFARSFLAQLKKDIAP